MFQTPGATQSIRKKTSPVDPPGGGRPYAPKNRRDDDPRFHSISGLKRFSVEGDFLKNKKIENDFFVYDRPVSLRQVLVGWMTLVAECFYYVLDRFEEACYKIDEWKRDASDVQLYTAMVVVFFVIGLLFMGCSLPDRTHKLTVIGLGVLPPPVTGLPFPVPFFGYWHSEHEKKSPVVVPVVSEVERQAAEPKIPTYD